MTFEECQKKTDTAVSSVAADELDNDHDKKTQFLHGENKLKKQNWMEVDLKIKN